MIVIINNTPILVSEAQVSALYQNLEPNMGIFSTLRVENGSVLNWELHKQRLVEHCAFFGLKGKVEHEDCYRLIDLNAAQKGIWKLKIVISKSRDASPYVSLQLTPYEDMREVWSLASLRLSRNPILSHYKTLSMERDELAQLARQQGVDEILLCDEKGILLETSKTAIFWVVENRLYYPSLSLPLLKSTALTRLIENKSIKSSEVIVTLNEIPSNASIYAINALRGVIPIRKIDHREFPLNENLENTFLSLLGINRA